MENLKELFEQRGVKASQQRLMVLANLSKRYDHPCAETIYQDLHPNMPTLSRTTVYSTLELLVQHNLVHRLTIEDGVNRYDANVATHPHFYCHKCRRVLDVESNVNDFSWPVGYHVEGCQLFGYGICPECQGSGEYNKSNLEEEQK